MGREKLTRYIIEKYKDGYSFEKIKESLIKSDFSPELVEQVIHEVKINNLIAFIEEKNKLGYKESAIRKLLQTLDSSPEDIETAMAHFNINEKAKSATEKKENSSEDGFNLDLDSNDNKSTQTISYSVNKTSQRQPMPKQSASTPNDSGQTDVPSKSNDSTKPNEKESSPPDASNQNFSQQENNVPPAGLKDEKSTSNKAGENTSSDKTASNERPKSSSSGPSFFESIKNYTKNTFDSIVASLKSLDFSSLNKLNVYHYMIIGFVFITVIVSIIFILIDFKDEPESEEPGLPDFSLDTPETEFRAGSQFNYSIILEDPPKEDNYIIIEYSVISTDTGEVVLSDRKKTNIHSLDEEELTIFLSEDIPAGNYTLNKKISNNLEEKEFAKNFTIEKSYEELCEDCPEGQVCFEGSCCEPETCISQGYACGKADDGCGNELDCGDCLDGEVCENGQCLGEEGSCKNNETVTWSNETGEGNDCGPVSFGDRHTVEGETQQATFTDEYEGQATFECVEGSWEFVEGSCLEPDYNLFIDIEGEGNTTPELGRHMFFENETIEITAEPAEGWEFDSFSGDCSGETCSLVMDDDKEVTVNFIEEPQDCNMEASVSWSDESDTGNDCGPVSFGEGTLSHGQQESVSYSEDEYSGSATYECSDGNWEFVESTCERECISNDNKKCYDGDVYWYDSCGERQTTDEICDYGCEDGECLEEETEYTLTVNVEEGGSTSPTEGTHTYTEGETV
ncbi:MAG: InlB B-repeat-containing protein, partial [Candidatus Nanoarchaeia archaeon]